jgi:RimJ/RimL family protein N-acetyltransferase
LRAVRLFFSFMDRKPISPKPTVLDGQFVRLEPLGERHFPQLIEIGLSPEVWKWTTNVIREAADLERYLRSALDDGERGLSVPFATVLKQDGRVVGSTRFGNIDLHNRKTEIGWTWIGVPWQRTVVNTGAKFLMLTHAFETWECIRVELKTDANNEQSRAAMRRIGCVEEGTLRNHMITESGRFRDSVYFSIIESEWPAIKERLRARLYDHQ